MNLKALNKILLFGKSRAFSEEEFLSQMQFHKIELVEAFDASVDAVVEGRMMTPYEQNSFDALYEEHGMMSYSIDLLERALAQEIDANALLMSLKLSRNKERLKSFIQNSCIDDVLFFRLMQMYSWGGEDFFENDDNRDVSAAFIGRFYENIERNHNVQFATTGFIHLVSQAKNSQMLEAILALEPLQFHPKITMAIAMSPYCDEPMQKRLHRRGDAKIDEALSLNSRLSLALVEEFMQDAVLGENVAKSIDLDEERFQLLLHLRSALAHNRTLTQVMQEQLLKRNDDAVNLALAGNSALHEQVIEALLSVDDEAIKERIYANPATKEALLEQAYQEERYHASLAQNESTPVDILYQLQLDSRYERFVKANAGFGKYIQSENLGWL